MVSYRFMRQQLATEESGDKSAEVENAVLHSLDVVQQRGKLSQCFSYGSLVMDNLQVKICGLSGYIDSVKFKSIAAVVEARFHSVGSNGGLALPENRLLTLRWGPELVKISSYEGEFKMMRVQMNVAYSLTQMGEIISAGRTLSHSDSVAADIFNRSALSLKYSVITDGLTGVHHKLKLFAEH